MNKIKEYVEMIMDKFGDDKKVIVIGAVVLGVILLVALV